MYLAITAHFTTYKIYQQFDQERTALNEQEQDFEAHLEPVLSRLMELPSWGHVQSMILYSTFLTVYLKREHRDSPLPREIAQAFHAKGEKEAGEDTLSVSYHLGEVHLTVAGYLPPSCRLVVQEEWVPAGYREVRKVVCTDSPTSGADSTQ